MSRQAFCTLFDSNYLDKGLVLFESLAKNCNDFTLYVLAMNDKCFEILSTISDKRLVPIKLDDFLDEDLIKAKESRSWGEFCFTCSAPLVIYIFSHYNEAFCSYIDADMAFYADPKVIIEELNEKKASVLITGHRFCSYEAQKRAEDVGKYCVECNTFKNDSNSLKLLEIWKRQCLDCCSVSDGIHYGDQKYMDNWVSDFDFVYETENMGAGVAPWNLPQYKQQTINGKSCLFCKNEPCELLFYHFEGIANVSNNQFDIHVFNRWGIDVELVKSLYIPYLSNIVRKRQYLKHTFDLDIKVRFKKSMWADVSVFKKTASLLLRMLNMNPKDFIYLELPFALYHKRDIIDTTVS